MSFSYSPRQNGAASLLAWNVLEGLSHHGKADLDPVRVLAAQALVDRLDPDILILNEALYCEPHDGRYCDYGRIFDYPYTMTALYAGSWGNAILSRYPIVDELRVLIRPTDDSHDRGALAAKVEIENGTVWIGTLHPHPRRAAFQRAVDFERFIEKLDGPAILAGDFNAISPEDSIDAPALHDAFTRFCLPGEANVTVQRFLDAGTILFRHVFPHFGLRDAFAPETRRPTMPTQLLGVDRASAIRIDHIVVNSSISVVESRVIEDYEADIASDHYPVLTKFFVRPRSH